MNLFSIQELPVLHQVLVANGLGEDLSGLGPRDAQDAGVVGDVLDGDLPATFTRHLLIFKVEDGTSVWLFLNLATLVSYSVLLSSMIINLFIRLSRLSKSSNLETDKQVPSDILSIFPYLFHKSSNLFYAYEARFLLDCAVGLKPLAFNGQDTQHP